MLFQKTAVHTIKYVVSGISSARGHAVATNLYSCSHACENSTEILTATVRERMWRCSFILYKTTVSVNKQLMSVRTSVRPQSALFNPSAATCCRDCSPWLNRFFRLPRIYVRNSNRKHAASNSRTTIDCTVWANKATPTAYAVFWPATLRANRICRFKRFVHDHSYFWRQPIKNVNFKKRLHAFTAPRGRNAN